MCSSEFKDHFSGHSNEYGHYRPVYPSALFDWLARNSPSAHRCWDCATGTGQAAQDLARHFSHVIATDASAEQISSAVGAGRIDYRVAHAEKSGIDERSVDLITVAQALHWFDIPAFFKEADRVLKPQGLLAIISYNLLTVDAEINAVILQLYHDILGDYWPPERRLIEESYANIKLPYTELDAPVFHMQANWNLAQLMGYLNTWSAVKHYTQVTGESSLKLVEGELRSAWGDPLSVMHIQWPLNIRVAIKPFEAS